MNRSLFLLLLALAQPLHAAGLNDPFGELDDAPAPPCRQPAEKAALALLDVVDLALCHNPQTREVWANARVQAAQAGVARAAYLPTLDGKLVAARKRPDNGATYRQNDATLTFGYLLYDFGARSAALENARQLLAAAGATQDATVQAVFLSAVQAYYQAQTAEAALAAARESERASRESLKAAEVRYRVGSGTPADRLQAQTAWSQAVLNRIAAEGSLKGAQGALANVIGRDAHRGVPLAPMADAAPAEGFERDVEALVAEARRRRPDLRAAESQVKAAQANTDAARAAGRPTLSFAATAGNQGIEGSAYQHSGSLGVTLNIPLFSGFATTYKVRAAEAQADARAAQRDRVSLQVALDVWNANHGLATATQSLRSAADLLASALQSEGVALGRYRAGVGSILDVLNAQSALAAARQQKVQAAYNWNVARAALAQAMGSLDFDFLQSPPHDTPLSEKVAP
ncbi:MAG: TolC family protein [Sulfuricellaceae bacterium]